MLASTSSPRPAVVTWLGYGGLLPFLILATASVAWPAWRAAWWTPALVGYGAVILSFVGALHWAFAMTVQGLPPSQRTWRYVWSVVPALVAWPALLLPLPWAGALLIAGFAAHLAQDLQLKRSTALPAWYLRLRMQLTAVACLCLAVGSWAGSR